METDLFGNSPEKLGPDDSQPAEQVKFTGPLAERMRPQRLEEFFGQSRLVGGTGVLRRAVESDELHSIILWGPPGCGKTTLANLIARHTNAEFVGLSAVMSGVKDIKEAVANAQFRLRNGRKTILFVDEIHRFNKSQQDALLPYVENGTVTLIGATTENPSFELNSALLSRAPVYRLESLSRDDITGILKRALNDQVRGLGKITEQDERFNRMPQEFFDELSMRANGDARSALTMLESIAEYITKESGEWTLETLKSALGERTLRYDKAGEEHFNTVSAFIKSMRANDPDAAVYYLARMLEGGEDPLFVARRMVVFASEDIGNADPRALQMALAARDAVDFVGMPEARINLGHIATYLAVAPKSRAAYNAIGAAQKEVQETGNLQVPRHLLNYPPDDLEESKSSGNLPQGVRKKRFYLPTESGLEKQISEKLRNLKS